MSERKDGGETDMEKIAVKDMRPALRDACINRGYREAEEITPKMAAMEYAGWHIGDPSFAKTIIDLYENPRGD